MCELVWPARDQGDRRVAATRRSARGLLAPKTNAITFVQRFGGLVNPNVHFHLVVPDACSWMPIVAVSRSRCTRVLRDPDVIARVIELVTAGKPAASSPSINQ